MKIDSHHHLWTYSDEEFGWIDPHMAVLRRDFTAEEFGRNLMSAGYDGSIVVQARQSLSETRFLLDAARAWPFIRGVVGWVDLASDDLSQWDELDDPRLVGVRHVAQAEPEGYFLRPEVQRGLREVQRRGLVYELLLLPWQLSEAVQVVRLFPDMNFVLDHLGKPMEGSLDVWRRNIEPLAEYPGVSVKVSGLFSESWPSQWDEATIGYLLDTAFDLFGPQRILAASNWPVSELAGPYDWAIRWVEEYADRFPSEVRAQILGENAVRVYGLRNGRT